MLCLSKSSLSLKSLDSVSASSAEPAPWPGRTLAAGAGGELVDTEPSEETTTEPSVPSGTRGREETAARDSDLTKVPDEHGSITELQQCLKR